MLGLHKIFIEQIRISCIYFSIKEESHKYMWVYTINNDMKLLLLPIVLLICLCGCETVRTNTVSEEVKQEVTKETTKNDIFLDGEVAGVPVHLTLKQKGTTDTKSEERKEEKKEEVTQVPIESNFGWLSSLLMILGGGGIGGFAIKQLKDGMIKRMSNGIQSFLDENKKTGESLKTHLSRKMNDSDKRKIRRIKG